MALEQRERQRIEESKEEEKREEEDEMYHCFKDIQRKHSTMSASQNKEISKGKENSNEAGKATKEKSVNNEQV